LTTELNNRDRWFENNNTNGSESFQKHNQLMKAFRRSHPDIARINTSSFDRFSILEKTRPLRLQPILTDTGGSWIANGIDDWSLFVAALEVARHKFWQN